MSKFELLCQLKAISSYAYDIHYSAEGKNFYSDHLFSERLADIDVEDDYIETMYLGESEDAPSSKEINDRVALITPDIVDDMDFNFKSLRDMIVKALMMIQKYDYKTKAEEDLLGSVAHILQRHNGLLFRQLKYTKEEIRNSDDDVDYWFSTKTGVHIPVKDGQSKGEAVKDFFQKKAEEGIAKKTEKTKKVVKAQQYTEEQIEKARRVPFIDTKEGAELYTRYSDEEDKDKKAQFKEELESKNREYNDEGLRNLPNRLDSSKYYMSETDYDDEKVTSSIFSVYGINKERRSFDLRPIDSKSYSDVVNAQDITRGNLVEMTKDEAMERWSKMPQAEGVFGGLTGEEKRIIKSYTYATPENSALRKGEKIPSAEKLSSIIDRSLNRNMFVYRGVTGEYAKILKRKNAGDIIEEKGFVSTSMDSDVSKKFAENGAFVTIKVPRGYGKALRVSEFSLHPEEQEVLLNKGLKFRVVHNMPHEIMLEIVEDEKTEKIKEVEQRIKNLEDEKRDIDQKEHSPGAKKQIQKMEEDIKYGKKKLEELKG